MHDSRSSLYIGLMSGTSLDGVDAVLAHIDHKGTKVLAHQHQPFPSSLRHSLASLCTPSDNEIHRLGMAERELTQQYTSIVKTLLAQAQLSAKDIAAIGCHGQTLRHHPELGFSLQANNPGALAAHTRIAVVSDFRRADIALGGQGAPLVPKFHLYQFASSHSRKAILNLGGIANITLITDKELLLGFDTGPANTLLDAWCLKHTGHYYDKAGKWAQEGQLLTTLLENMLADSYFTLPPPKSTGREHFNMQWLAQFLKGDEAPEDVQHTLTHLTARTIALALEQNTVDELVVCGGGAYNTFLLARLEKELANTKVVTSEEYGLPPEQVEATAFAWLAWANQKGIPGNAPQTTGAARELVLGGFYRN